MPASTAINNKNELIEVLRFLAAFAVFFVHIPLVEKGHFGVDVFFVISGYVMMLSTRRNGDNFFLKRLIRIVPTYYALTIAVFCIAIVMPSLLITTTPDIAHLIKSLLFIPFIKNGIEHSPILFLGWTLNYEMYFYLMFAMALAVSHRYRGLLVSVLIFSIWCLCDIADVFYTRVYGDLMVFEFVLGVLLYMIMTLKSEPQFRWQIVGIVLLLVVMMALPQEKLPASRYLFTSRFFFAGLPSVLFIYLALVFLKNRRMPGILVVLGGASYVFYLTHPYVIRLVSALTGWFDGSMVQQLLALVLSIVAANVIAVVLYRYLEAPLTNQLRKWLLRRRQSGPEQPSVA